MGARMRRTVRAGVVLGFSSLVISAGSASADTFALKCDAQKDSVWVYDSLATMNVQAKLACGQTVEVIDRAAGYALIRSANGVQGYIPENDFANLPGFKARHEATPDVATAAKTAQAREMAQYAATKNAFAGAPPSAAASSAPITATAAGSSAPAGVASYQLAEMAPRPSAAPAPKPVAVAAPSAPGVTITETVTEIPNPAPAPATVIAPAPKPDEAPKAALASASANIPDETVANISGVRTAHSDGCRAYFSAYGLTTSQLKWIEQNRSKEFAGVCPAPDVQHVTYVIIFTHDVDFYSVTMPSRVHNANGFSDFQPMVTVDNALMSESEANKAHREYVWVFNVGEGSFDPNTFSPHRASQFAKEESNGLGGRGSQKAVEDAFRYVEGSNH